MEQNLKAIVRYDGTNFSGWQIQPDRRTVQGELQRVLSVIAGQPIHVFGAGRTDAGVHAMGQVCSFIWPGDGGYERIKASVSQMLRPDLRVESIVPAAPDFHARHSARAKRYVYALARTRLADPFTERYAHCVATDFVIERVPQLILPLLGEHNFAGYQCVGSEMSSTVREIYTISLSSGGFVTPGDTCDLWRIEFCGSGFLYKMVRNLVGTLIEVLSGRVAETVILERLESPGPYRGYTAPACGLCLERVFYDGEHKK
jgi:tRNA pseudouridine38-40 synthase